MTATDTRTIDNGAGWKREMRLVQRLGSDRDGTATVEAEFIDTRTRTFLTPAEWDARMLNRGERDEASA